MVTGEQGSEGRGFASRKFLLAVACLLTGFYLAVIGTCDLGSYTMLVATILGAYNGSDTVRDFIFNRAATPPTKAKRKPKTEGK